MTTATQVALAKNAVPVRQEFGWLQLIPFIASDAVAVFFAAAAAVLVRYAFGGEFELSSYLRMSVVTGFFVLAYAMLGLYPAVMLHPAVELQGIFRGTTLTILLLGTLTFFQRDAEEYSRAILLGSWFLIMVTVWTGRVLSRHFLSKTSWWGERAVILGGGRAGRTVAEMLRSRPGTGLRVVAILDDDPEKRRRSSGLAPITAPLYTAAQLASEFGVRYAIVAMPDAKGRELSQLIEHHASGFHHVLIIPDLFGVSSLGVDARDLGGILGVRVSHRLLYRTPQMFKRFFDLAAATTGGLLLAPVVALAYVLIRLTSPGPGFFGHARIGLRGERFTAWKFRTMVREADEVLGQHLDEFPERRREWEQDRKLKDDPRVTWIGRLLRRTSMDELPQLWNVIRGHMSLVGPRPIVEDEVEKYGSRYSLYQKVRPGLTGMWQVSGRNNTTYAERVQFDEYYVRNWSIWLDLYILSRTVRVVLTGEGAY